MLEQLQRLHAAFTALKLNDMLACFAGDFFCGKADVTRNAYGIGKVYCIATVGQQALYNKLVRSGTILSASPLREAVIRRKKELGKTGRCSCESSVLLSVIGGNAEKLASKRPLSGG